MAEALRNAFGPEIAGRLAAEIAAVRPDFPRRAFLADALRGFDELGLMARGLHLARALRAHLPDDYPAALDLLLASIGPPLDDTEGQGMAPFFYLPHTCFVAEYGLAHFEASMRAQHALTRRFTAEFSIRPFLEAHPGATLARLAEWAADPSPHVRRLVSEGTRPRLPWGRRLRAFQADPRPVLALLESLKDDPSPYVRRSVANNLNDIGKDHPELLVDTARRWLVGAGEARRWIVGRALRSAVRRGEAGALAVLGVGRPAEVAVGAVHIAPRRPRIGGAVEIAFALTGTGAAPQRVLVDFRIHFVKADGKARSKVFKLKTIALAPGETVALSKRVSLAEMTTRRPHPGRHAVDAVLNGRAVPLGAFDLVA
jgi:3-methyladenine DNA glycosylase AlkC